MQYQRLFERGRSVLSVARPLSRAANALVVEKAVTPNKPLDWVLQYFAPRKPTTM
jgi:uncharacterized membrane protein